MEKKEKNIPKLNLREIMKEKNVTMEELGRLTGKTKATVSNQMDGNMSLSTLKDFADALGVEIADFFVVPDGYMHWQVRNGRIHGARLAEENMTDISCPYCHAHFYIDPKQMIASNAESNDPSLLVNNPAFDVTDTDIV